MADVEAKVVEKVTTRHPPAQEAIDSLRDAAVTLKQLGDSTMAYLDLEEAHLGVLDELDEAKAQAQHATHLLSVWEDLLADFKRGIRSREELLTGTVGL